MTDNTQEPGSATTSIRDAVRGHGGSAEAPAGRCPVAHGFDTTSNAFIADPGKHFGEARAEAPAFWYEPLNGWMFTRREDAMAILNDWEVFGSGGITAAKVPERHVATYPPELVARMIVGQDPPEHTHTRQVAQRGFMKDRMERLRPEIEARASRVLEGIEERGEANIIDDYCLELTTRTIMALLDLGYEHREMLMTLRHDLLMVIASTHEQFPQDFLDGMWDRFVNANMVLREIIEERRYSDADDLISTMASAKNEDGSWALDIPRIGLHIAEFAAAGADTTAQAMGNAILFLTENPEYIEEAINEPELWDRVFEETIRRRASSNFTSRVCKKDTVVGGIKVREGEMVHVALTGANTDPEAYDRPYEFDIHRPDPTGHLGFSTGRHKCLGNPLARVQGPTGLKVLFERLPSLRAVMDQPLDFHASALLPIRKTLKVTWDPADVQRQKEVVVRTANLEVKERKMESDGVVSLRLVHPDGGELPKWRPGAHIDLHVTALDGEDLVRQYSLSSDPADRFSYRVGVLREPAGRGGSEAVHETLQEGSRVTVSWPRNNFRLVDAPEYIFIAGGIGITPILTMVREAEAQGKKWKLVYGGRTRGSMAFLDELAPYGDRVTLVPQDELGHIDLPGVLGEVVPGALVYVCGPEPLLAACEANTEHWPKDSLRLERFAPKRFVRTEPDEPFEVEFTKTGKTITVPADKTILDAAEEAGVKVISSCAEGTCGTCETKILAGLADHRDSILSATEQERNDTMMICVSRAKKGCSKLVLDR